MAQPIVPRPASPSPTRRAMTLVEILIVLGIMTALALPFIEMLTSSKRRLAGLPKKLCAFYFAHDLMEERLDKRTYKDVRTISKRKMTEFAWMRDNIKRVARSETGERKARINQSTDFLDDFEAEVEVIEEVPGRRKKIIVTVDWSEGIHAEHVVLTSTLEI